MLRGIGTHPGGSRMIETRRHRLAAAHRAQETNKGSRSISVLGNLSACEKHEGLQDVRVVSILALPAFRLGKTAARYFPSPRLLVFAAWDRGVLCCSADRKSFRVACISWEQFITDYQNKGSLCLRGYNQKDWLRTNRTRRHQHGTETCAEAQVGAGAWRPNDTDRPEPTRQDQRPQFQCPTATSLLLPTLDKSPLFLKYCRTGPYWILRSSS